ncbi:hypothetical protein F2Q69_00037711 [Brassica cretica]|uniref:Uncharacterized protein n=1 Tax=Brassica cretica TaxID=69181 RepID=A0A8S9SS85_BRACR|nr:hypothetical protein F2Q69_00037711 [Brassica cretica]
MGLLSRFDRVTETKSFWEKVHFIISSRSLDSPQGDSLEVTISSLRPSPPLSASSPSLSVSVCLQPSRPSPTVSSRLRLSLFVRMDNEDTMNLEDNEYMSGDEMVDQNSDEDEAVAVEDTLIRTAENRRKRGGKRRHSRCWKHFNIIGENYPDGSNDIQ